MIFMEKLETMSTNSNLVSKLTNLFQSKQTKPSKFSQIINENQKSDTISPSFGNRSIKSLTRISADLVLEALEKDELDQAVELLQNPNLVCNPVNLMSLQDYLVRESVKNGKINTRLKILLEFTIIKSVLSLPPKESLEVYAYIGDCDGIKKTLENNPNLETDIALNYVVAANNLEAVNLLMNSRSGLPTNYAVTKATILGNLEMLKLIIQNPAYDLSQLYLLNIAAIQGHTEILQFLLDEQRINPILSPSSVLWDACMYGRTEIVRLLLNDQRIIKGGMNKDDFLSTKQFWKPEVVELLLNNSDLRLSESNELNNLDLNLSESNEDLENINS